MGRCTTSGSRAIEDGLAKAVEGSETIYFFVKRFIKQFLLPVHTRTLTLYRAGRPAVNSPLEGMGRYAYFYSPLIGKNRNLDQAIRYLAEDHLIDPGLDEMAAFLCDYALAARGTGIPMATVHLSNADARNGHFNVNEQSAWVLRARQARVRLGAGPSATTMNVLNLVKGVMVTVVGTNRSLAFSALALFAFWNRNRGKLYMRSEIHTFHEVMLPLADMGIPLVAALSQRGPLDVAEFEYPEVGDIPP